MTRRIFGTRPVAAAAIAAHLICMAAAGPALAMQILDAADHAELEADAAALAGTMGLRIAAAWLAGPGSGPSGGRLAVIVIDASEPADAIPADVFPGGPQ